MRYSTRLLDLLEMGSEVSRLYYAVQDSADMIPFSSTESGQSHVSKLAPNNLLTNFVLPSFHPRSISRNSLCHSRMRPLQARSSSRLSRSAAGNETEDWVLLGLRNLFEGAR